MIRLAVVAAMLSACGDNLYGPSLPLGPAAELVVVAHPDDDLMFMQPDVADAVREHRGVTIVSVTAGNAEKGVRYANDRIAGLRMAYSHITGDHAWTCAWIEIAGHRAQHCQLAEADLSIVFLGYPDGGKRGQLEHSLLRLWQGSIADATTIGAHTTRYDREGLVATLAEIMTVTNSSVVRTLEIGATHGRDNIDHMLVGALTVLAMTASRSDADLISYRGYSVEREDANLPDLVFQRSARAVNFYDACADGCAPCGQACDRLEGARNTWLRRRYAYAMRRPARGQLRTGDRCLQADATLGECATAPVWSYAARDLRLGDRCLRIADGATIVASCDSPTPGWFFDEEGHVWLGMAPAPVPDMEYAHLNCLDADARVTLCGAGRTTVWQLAAPTTVTARTAIDWMGAGRAVRLADVTGDGHADLCEARAGGVACASGRGDGTFDTAASIETTLAIDPDSLTIGDLDGDARADVCGRGSGGLACANVGAAGAWLRSPAFDASDATPATARSLAVVGAEVCGVATAGVRCVLGDASSTIRATWPSAPASVWFGDLDGDRATDWCAATAAGPACATAREPGTAEDPGYWRFSYDRAIENATGLDADTAALADVDGDGRADLCTLDAMAVVCAFSQGDGFGPRTPIAVLPFPATSLWLGDLDGDGRADPCAADDARIACAPSR